ncbi:hypothetical protein SscP1EGY_64 [Streptomyces phage SscP1EGY]|nr:hypothetical protein SscP1EGY_64 [Streptomyces phage SscP1EGY]
MATVTVVNAERTLEIEATSIVSGLVNEAGHLILTRHDGTDLDMGAVSGMQLDNGTAYSKVDAFTYVGDTDPGAVPNGSVWLDTNDVAGPFASDTQKGLVELATNEETISGTDNTRAVTPAGLAAVPGTKVQTVSGITESSPPSAWPTGVSIQSVTSGSGWSLENGFGTIVTHKIFTDRTHQTFYANAGGTTAPKVWTRSYHTTTGGGGWTAWSQSQLMRTIAPGTIVQTTAFSAYPMGWSRMYFTPANSTGWDFAGNYGELLTFVDGTEFAKQTWTYHSKGGDPNPPEVWIRSANTTGGWSAWRKFMTDPGAWINYTPTWTSQTSSPPSFGNASIKCKYQKIGRTVNVKFWINFGSTTNFGSAPTTSDNWQFSLPVPAADASDDSLGLLEMYQNASNCGWARVKLYSTTGFRLGIGPGSTAGIGGDVDSISPFVWASGNYLRGTFTYESAS